MGVCRQPWDVRVLPGPEDPAVRGEGRETDWCEGGSGILRKELGIT